VKRILFLAIVALLGFYVAWPAWSGYSIRNAILAKDHAALASKVDFDSVQASLRPAVTQKVNDGFDRYASQMGPTGGLVIGQLKKDAVPKIVDASLRTLLTPENIIRIATEAGPMKESFERIMRDQMGRGLPAVGAGADGTPAPQQGLGGLLGKALQIAKPPATQSADATPAGTPAPASDGTKPKFSLSNIKSFSFAGPLSFQVGVAKNPAAAEADVTAQMSFTGGDWKITSLIPRL
jgi:Protein of unknown function (DUF2939)